MKGFRYFMKDAHRLHPNKQPQRLVPNQNRSLSRHGKGPMRRRMRGRPQAGTRGE